MKRLGLLVGMLLVCGCSGDDGGSKTPTGPCGKPNGTYRMHYTEQSGDCGPVADNLTTYGTASGSTSTTSSCTGTQTPSADGCSITSSNVTCQTDSGFIVVTGKMTWTPGEATGSATMDTEILNPSKVRICRSLYGVTYTKL